MARHRKLTQKFAGFPMFKLATSGDTFPLTSPFTTEFVGLDGLALDLQFAADKTLTARKGPTPVFTRGSSGTFVGSNGLIQSAGTNVARFDHDPASLACKGLLIEESRTNICLQSGNLGTTWVTTNTAISANTEVAPDGSTTADTATVSNAGSNFLAQQITVTASTQYTFSFYVKRGSATNSTYSVYNNNASNDIVAPTSYFSQTSSSAWVRVSFQFTTPVGCTSIFAYMQRNTGSTGSMHFWGAQVEAGSFPTSYIPTTTTSVIRSADVCSITGSAFSGFYNTPEGTLFAIASTLSTNLSIRRIFSMTDGTIANRAGLLFNSVGQPTTFVVSSGGSLSALIASSVASITSPVKIAGAYKLDDFAISANGSAVTTDTLGLVGTGINRLGIGNQNDTEFVNGHIASMRYYKKRLPNAKLQALTV